MKLRSRLSHTFAIFDNFCLYLSNASHWSFFVQEAEFNVSPDSFPKYHMKYVYHDSRMLTEQNTLLCPKRICSRQTRVSRCWWQLPTSPNIMCRKHWKYARKESRKFRALVEENDESKNVWKPNWWIIASYAIKKHVKKW